jgi:hypothetical protein
VTISSTRLRLHVADRHLVVGYDDDVDWCWGCTFGVRARRVTSTVAAAAGFAATTGRGELCVGHGCRTVDGLVAGCCSSVSTIGALPIPTAAAQVVGNVRLAG